jgi:small subunit ribosomal protein S20
MPITSSAKKALRASTKKKVFNHRRKETMNKAVRDIKKLVSAKNTEEAKKLISTAQKAIDKAAKMNTISKNTASRKKSRLVALVKRAENK